MKCNTGPFHRRPDQQYISYNTCPLAATLLPEELLGVTNNCYVLFPQDLLVLEEQEVRENIVTVHFALSLVVIFGVFLVIHYFIYALLFGFTHPHTVSQQIPIYLSLC